MAKLAIDGGPRTVTIKERELWRPPVEEQKRAVGELIERDELSGAGHGVGLEFEHEFRDYTGAELCLSMDHGSSAIMAGLYAVGVGPGDEVIVPARGYIGSYTGVLHLGAKPIFCDCCPENALIDPADVEKRITPRTKAIVPIHFNGTVCDMDGLLDVRNRYGIPLVHDACHAHPSRWEGANLGSLPDVVCYSLQGSDPDGKPVSGGEGGVATTGVREYYERILIYCHLHRRGIEDELTRPEYRMLYRQGLGLKWRPHPIAMALARISLRSVDYRSGRRAAVRTQLWEGLQGVAGVHPVQPYAKAQDGGFYGGYRIIYAPEELGGLEATRFMAALQAEGVPAKFYRDGPEHLRALIQRGFDLWGNGRGMVGPGAYDHAVGDLPVTEGMLLEGRAMLLNAYVEPAQGLVEQIIAGVRKVSDWYRTHQA